MAKRRKKKPQRLIYPSIGALPARFAADFVGRVLVFSDASLKRQGGLAAVIFEQSEADPLVLTRSVPSQGSNELELMAALFALEQAEAHFPGQALALFSDNHDAVCRLSRALELGMAQDAELGEMLNGKGLPKGMQVRWIKAHASCRGNLLADQHAAEAAA